MRISSPPTTHSCFYGIDTPERGELLAARQSVEEMAEQIGVDSLAFISIDGLYRALGKPDRDPARPHYCDACFTGDYPIALPDQADNSDRQLEPAGREPADADAAGRAPSRWSPAPAAASARRPRWSWRGSARTW